jgi:hypothetical protein
MTKAEFEELHKSCTGTLNRYIEEANRTCEMLGECTPEPFGLIPRSGIHEQRLRENAAHQEFQAVRHALFGLLQHGYSD